MYKILLLTCSGLVREQEQALRKQALEELAAKNRQASTPLRSSAMYPIDLSGLTGVMNKLSLDSEGHTDTISERGHNESDINTPTSQSMMENCSRDEEERNKTMVLTPQRPAPAVKRTCTKCDSLAQELETQKADNCKLTARILSLEERVEKASKDLLAVTSEANLYKGQCLIFERLFMNKQSPT